MFQSFFGPSILEAWEGNCKAEPNVPNLNEIDVIPLRPWGRRALNYE